jgi:four helix bundle protein
MAQADSGGGKGFRGLKVWHKAMDAMMLLHAATKRFPKDELYGLTSQLRRAGYSIPMNIAEGYKRRRYKRDYVRFLLHAHGSEGEVETGIEIATRLGYWTEAEGAEHLGRYEEVGRMLDGLIGRVEGDLAEEGKAASKRQ